MKKLTNFIVIVGIVCAVIFLQHKFFPRVVDESTHTSDTIWNNRVVTITDTAIVPVYINTSRIDTVKIPADSAAIVAAYLKLHQNYNSTKYYNDTLKDDTVAFISLEEKVAQNEIKSRSLTYQNRVPTIINNTTISQSKGILYGQGQVGIDDVSVGLRYKTKKEYQYGLSYDFVGIERGLKFDVAIPIWIKK
jgi:hypothetical protein